MSSTTWGPVPTLFVHYGEEHLRGSEQVLLDLFGSLDRSRTQPILWCNSAVLAEAARRLDVPTQVTPMHYVDGLGAMRRRASALRRQVLDGVAIVRRGGVRLVHANSAAPVQWMAPAARMAGVPLLAHIHTAYSRRNRFLLLLHQSSLAVGASAAVLEGLRSDGMPPKRLRVILNGIDPRRLGEPSAASLRRELGIADDALVVGVAGSLIPRKATAAVLRAFAQLTHHRPLRLLVAGAGPDRAELEGLAGMLGITQRTSFIGGYSDAAAVFRTMDVNALASLDEAFGLVIVEAALCGVPSVASDIGGIREVVAHGITGLLVSPGNVAGLTAGIQRLVSDAALRGRLAGAARADALARFGAARMAAQFHAAYDDLLAMPPLGGGLADALRGARPYARLVRSLAGF